MWVERLSDIVPSTPIFILIVVPHTHCNSMVKSIYFSTFSFSFIKTFLSMTHATSIRNVLLVSLLTRTKSGRHADISLWLLLLFLLIYREFVDLVGRKATLHTFLHYSSCLRLTYFALHYYVNTHFEVFFIWNSNRPHTYSITSTLIENSQD